MKKMHAHMQTRQITLKNVDENDSYTILNTLDHMISFTVMMA